MRTKLLAGILIAWAHGGLFGQEMPAMSQVNRYFVYFSDKAAASYPYSLSNPSEFLSSRAITRRSNQNIPFTASDLPVAPAYVAGLNEVGADVFFTSKWLNGALINSDTALLDAIQALAYVDSIAWVADTTRLSFEKTEWNAPQEFTDPSIVAGDSDIQLRMLGVDQMHAENIRGQGMIIAVLDNGFSGVDQYAPFRHLWEEDRILAFRDFVQNSGSVFSTGTHGTAVLSIIAADYEEENGFLTGVAPGATFVLCTTEDNQAENTIEEYNWILGAEFADSLGADIINTSLGYRLFDIPAHNYDFEDLDGESTIIAKGVEIASDKGMVVVLSAGNEGNKAWERITTPADAKGALTVASVNADFTKSSFSSVGNTADERLKPDVAAFGAATAVVQSNGTISRGSGTSFAAPLIAGFAAGIWQANPERTSQEVIRAIKNSGHQSYAPDSLIGYGVPSFVYATDEKALNVNDILDDKVTFYPNPFHGDTILMLSEGKLKQGMRIKILDPNGTMVFDENFKKRQISDRMQIQFESDTAGVYFLLLQTGDTQKIVKLIKF